MADPTVAQQIFETWGVQFAPVPTSRKEEADWLVEMDGFTYLIEEKTKFPNPEDLHARSKSLDETNQFTSITPVSRSNTISGIVGKAKKQLKSTGESKRHQFRLVWFTAIGWDAETKHMQFIATLYGTSKVFEIEGKTLRECYFFYNSDFFRYRYELDGAIAAFHAGRGSISIFLCLNPYSPNYEMLKKSPIVARLPKGLTDPRTEEQTGQAYIADTEIDRKDSQAILRYLESKYKTGKLANMDLKMASSEFRLPPPDA